MSSVLILILVTLFINCTFNMQLYIYQITLALNKSNDCSNITHNSVLHVAYSVLPRNLYFTLSIHTTLLQCRNLYTKPTQVLVLCTSRERATSTSPITN